MSYGKIYETTWWGNPVKDGWGGIYYDLQTSQSFALDFAKIATDFTFTRSSFATRVNELGLIETVTDLGSELVQNGDFSNGSTDWNIFPDVSVTDGKLVSNVSAFTSIASQTNIIPETKLMQLKFDTVVNSGTLRLLLGSGGDVTEVTATGSYTFNVNSGTGGNLSLFGRSGGFDGSIDNISVKEVLEDDVPRIDYTNGEAEFLLEPQSTNLITYSEDFSDASWNKTNISVTANDINSLDGTLSADLINSLGINSCVIKATYPTLTIGNTYSFSCFAKKGNNDWIRLGHVSSGSTGCWFDLENGVVGTINSTSATIEDYGNGWYRCTNTFVATASSDSSLLFIGICDTDNSVNSGAVGKTDYVWGAQLEALPYATSYIPTNGSVVTRSAETCVDATPTINSEEGVLYAEISALADDGTNRSIALSDGTTSNRVNILFGASVNSIRAIVSSGGVTQFDEQNIVTSTLDTHKIAFKYKENDFALWIDGTEVVTDTSGITFSIGTLTELNFSVGGTSLPFYGRTKDLRVYTKALTDSELEDLTTL